VIDLNLTTIKKIGTLGSVASLLAVKEIMTLTVIPGILFQVREIYTTCRRCWNVATYKWKVYNAKIEI